MKLLLRKHFIMAIVSFAVLVGSVLLFFGFSVSMREREARVIEARDRLASFEQNKRTFAQEANEFEVLKERIVSLEQKMITKESVPGLLSSLEAMADARKVKLIITAASTGTPKVPIGKLHIDFSATGSFSAVNAFVADMLSQDYLIQFTRFALFQGGSEGQPEGVPVIGSSWQLTGGVDVVSF